MTLVAFQIDPLDTLDPASDTSLFLAEEALKRGMRLFTYQPQNLSFHQGRLFARGQWFKTTDTELLPLDTADYVLIRQNPPFDMAYLTATYLLGHLPASTCVVNSPQGLRDAPEKMLVTHFPTLMPPTLMSWDAALIADFFEEHEQAVIKPLYAFGGKDVQLVDKRDWREKFDAFKRNNREPPIFQQFLPEVREGDRRILLIDGEPLGAFRRIPPSDDIRSNLILGGRQAEALDLRPRDLEICQMIGPTLRRLGLFFVGIDVIGDFLIEINVTSPTGLKIYHQLTGKNLAQDFWQRLLDKSSL